MKERAIFVRCFSSYLPPVPPPHSPFSSIFIFPSPLFYPSLKYKTCLLSFLPPPPLSLHPRFVTLTFYLITSRMNQYGGSGYPTSTSTARASVFSVFSIARFILSFVLFLREERWNGIETVVQLSSYFSVSEFWTGNANCGTARQKWKFGL